MKKAFFILFIGISSVSYAQLVEQSNLPASVKTAFSKKYNGIDANWMKNHGNYEANFKQDNMNVIAVYSANGKWLQTRQVVKLHTTPPNIMSYMIHYRPKDKISKIYKVQKVNGIQYEAEIPGTILTFDDKGNFIK